MRRLGRHGNSGTGNPVSVVYAAYAAPGMMKMGLGCGSLGLEVGVGWEAVRSLEPRARVLGFGVRPI